MLLFSVGQAFDGPTVPVFPAVWLSPPFEGNLSDLNFKTVTSTPGDSGPATNAVIWKFFALAAGAIVLRINAQKHRGFRFAMDDYVMFLSLIYQGSSHRLT